MLKTVKFLCKTIGTYWYTFNQGVQIHCKWFDKNSLNNQRRHYINYIWQRFLKEETRRYENLHNVVCKVLEHY